MVLLDVGLGKTIIALTAIAERVDRLECLNTLVVAPKRVCSMVWRQEAARWTHTAGLTFSLVSGNATQRAYALRNHADVHLINYENLPWLADYLIATWLREGEYFPWRAIVYDEVDMLKNGTGVRSRALQRILPYFPYRIGMTGTPAGNGYIDLWGEYLVVDGGDRLGTNRNHYLDQYFEQYGYRHILRQGAEDEIKSHVADITISMTASEYLPGQHTPVFNDVWVDLPPGVRRVYDELERELFAELDAGGSLEVANEGSMLNKCLQIANGQPYKEAGSQEWYALHDAKLNVLGEIISESNGQPVLVAYEFVADCERIMEWFPGAVHLGGAMTPEQEIEIQRKWDSGQIPLLVGHPASMGHGLNLQHGGHIGVWFGLTWSLGLYLQLIGRLARQGQTQVPVFHRILARNTVDEAQLMALERKNDEQMDLKTTINDYRRKYSAR